MLVLEHLVVFYARDVAHMAPKKDVSNLGAVQPTEYGWRAEVSNVGKGPTRTTKCEAEADLALAHATPTRAAMAAVLEELRAAARRESDPSAPSSSGGVKRDRDASCPRDVKRERKY